MSEQDNEDLRKVKLKVTSPRRKILRILEEGHSQHLSAQDVYDNLRQQNEEIALATVYRVLTDFEAAGLIRRHNFAGGHSVFELDEGGHHDHLVCERCGRVYEFCDEEIEQRQEQVAKKAGFKMTHHNHTIYGICKACFKS